MNKAPQGALPSEQAPKSNTARQSDFKARKSAGGMFKRGDVWAHPEDWPVLRELEQQLRAARESQKSALQEPPVTGA